MADPTADLSQGPVLLSFSLATASFALATTFVRFYARRGIRGGFGADDYTSGAATLIALIATIFGILEGTASSGERALQFDVIGQPWYLMSATLSKISICLFFILLLRRARQWRTLLAGLIAVMAVVNLAFALFVYLQCGPLEKAWKPSAAGGCLDAGIRSNFGYAQGAFSVFSWVFLSLFPMLIIRDISHGGEPAWPFYAASFLSFVSGIFVIVRIAQIPETTGTAIYNSHYFIASLMANLEQNLALTCSNLLTLGPLFSPSMTTFSTSSSSTNRSRSRSHSKRRPRPRRDPYGSASSSGTRRSAKRDLMAARGGSAGSGGDRSGPSRAESSRSITRPETPDSATGRGDDISRGSSRFSSRGEEEGTPGSGLNGVVADTEGRGTRVSNAHHEEQDLGERTWGVGGYGSEEDDDWSYDSDAGSDIDLEAWPRGIIKTVSVEVVEEVNEEYVAAAAAAAAAATTAKGSNANGDDGGARAMAGTSSTRGIGRNSVVIAPGIVPAGRRPRVVGAGSIDISDRVSGASGIEQDWEAMLRAGPPR
ncbi:hypothetical protein VTI28DRAFT_703 [Corynascus sepedonium]